MDRLREKLSHVAKSPGVYLMRDNSGNVIYVGKASNLKNRLSSYFARSHLPDLKTGVLVQKVADFEIIITATEKEALILESNLIKRYRPRYNVILKDDKRYPSLRIDIKSEYPCLSIVRKIKNDGALYFGPYASAGAVRETLKIINKTFKLRKCRTPYIKPRSRPCLNYQIGACLGPCCLDVSPAEYQEVVNEVRLFLNGRTHDLIDKIRKEMEAAAAEEEFEKAAVLRDKMFALEKTVEKQVAVTTDFMDRDVLTVIRNELMSLVLVMLVRNGRLQGMRHFTFKDILSEESEVLGAFVKQYYEHADYIPPEIITNVDIDDIDLYIHWLSDKRGRRVTLAHPRRGDKAKVLRMALENAQIRLNTITEEMVGEIHLLESLQHRLGLNRFPSYIECIDNSGLQGQDLVSGIVRFENAKPQKSGYRKYTIRTVDAADDYACMSEVLKRRYGKEINDTSLPDLIVVDGGKGQLNIAVSVLKQLGLANRLNVIGIAKKEVERGESDDKIYIPGRANPVNFSGHREELLLLQRIRDEAHRHAITFHRKRRSARSLRSVLDEIPGIGEKRKSVLLKQFKSIEKIRSATVDDLYALPGMNRRVAQAVVDSLRGKPETMAQE